MSLPTAVDIAPEGWQTGGRGLTLGLFIMALALLMFEAGHWAGTLEEREYWAPDASPPRKWPPHFRFLLRWWAGLRGVKLPRRRAKAPETHGRHRMGAGELLGLVGEGPDRPGEGDQQTDQHEQQQSPAAGSPEAHTVEFPRQG